MDTSQSQTNGVHKSNGDSKAHSLQGPQSDPRKRGPFTINRQTLPLKVTLFLFYGAMSALLPYLTIHMRHIGISIQEVAVIYAVLPFATFIAPPFMGLLADKWGDYKIVLIISTIGCGGFHSLLLLVPSYHVSPIPGHAVLHWDHQSGARLLPSHSSHCTAFQAAGINTDSSFHCLEDGFDDFELGLTFEDGLTFDSVNCSVQVPLPKSVKVNSSRLRCRTTLEFWTGEEHVEGDGRLTFWLYFALRMLSITFMASCFTLLDATTLAVVKKCGTAEYGKERIWCILGLAIMSPIAGLAVDQVSRAQNYTDYSPAFYLSNVLLILNTIAYFCMDLEVEKPEPGFLKNGCKLLRYPEVIVFLTMIFVMGTLYGFVESYLFVFLKELDAPNYLLGLTLTIGSLTGLPFLWGAERIVGKVGRVNLLILAFLTYFVRYFGYSYITDPFWCFPFEAMEAMTYHLMWTAAATYCSILAPKGLLATLTGIMGTLHYSLGKGNGSFIGGYLFGEIGARLTFRCFGIAAGIAGIIFFLVDWLWIRDVVNQRLKDKEEAEKKLENGNEVKAVLNGGGLHDN